MKHVHVNDSGDYECQVTGYGDDLSGAESRDLEAAVLNRKLEVNVFKKGKKRRPPLLVRSKIALKSFTKVAKNLCLTRQAT